MGKSTLLAGITSHMAEVYLHRGRFHFERVITQLSRGNPTLLALKSKTHCGLSVFMDIQPPCIPILLNLREYARYVSRYKETEDSDNAKLLTQIRRNGTILAYIQDQRKVE